MFMFTQRNKEFLDQPSNKGVCCDSDHFAEFYYNE